MATKRSSADLDREVETELRKLLCDNKCGVCIVPITSDQQREKHYAGKIHAKKVEKWRESWLGRKRARLEERVVIDDRSEQSVRSDIRETSSEDDVHSTAPEREVIGEEEPVSVLASSALDPRLLDQLDPSAMKKMLNIKKKNRWDTPEDDNTEEQSDDPSDYSIPQSYNKLMQRCFNSNTGLGYCQICNKLFRSETETSKHFSSSKHSAKVQIYNELLRSEAAVLAGLAQPNPPPHRGYYCEVCEADCSSESQLEQHLCGDRHRTNLRSMERELASDPELDKDINPYNLPELWLRERKHCNLCDVAISSIRMAKIHFNNRNHRLAAGLHITEESRMSEYNSRGDIHCDTCNYNVETQIEMKTHQAGIRHLENERTRQAVEGAGHTWSCHHPAPADQPRYSVQDPGNGWSGDSIGVTPESMMGPHPGMMYPGHMMGGPMPGPYMAGPMGPYPPGPWQPPMMSEKRRYAGVDVDNLNCSLCEVKFTSREQLDHHLENPTHMEKAANVPIDEDESVDYVPVPLTADNISSVRTKTHPIHCPFCKVWFPTITVLKYYHRYIIIICCWRGLITVNNVCSSYRSRCPVETISICTLFVASLLTWKSLTQPLLGRVVVLKTSLETFINHFCTTRKRLKPLIIIIFI